MNTTKQIPAWILEVPAAVALGVVVALIFGIHSHALADKIRAHMVNPECAGAAVK